MALTFAAFLSIGPDAPQGGDTVPNRYLPFVALCGGVSLRPLRGLWGAAARDAALPYYAVRGVDGRPYSTFGPAAPLLATPVYAAARTVDPRFDFARVVRLSRLLAAALSAVAAAAVAAAATRAAGLAPAIFATLAFALGSGVLTVTSRGLWQHTWATPSLALATLLWVRARGAPGPSSAAMLGALLALAAAVRPPTGVCLAVTGLWLARSAPRSPRVLAAFVAGAIPPLALVAIYNARYLGGPLTFGQLSVSAAVAQAATGSAALWRNPLGGALGLLASPSRGLLWLSPVFALAAPGARAAWGDDPAHAPLRLPTLWCVAMLAVAASWWDWWGGETVSYRPIVDALPMLAVLVAVAAGRLRTRFGRALAAVALCASIVVSTRIASRPGLVNWTWEHRAELPAALWRVRDGMLARAFASRPEDRAPLTDCAPITVEGCRVTASVRAR